jgi:hypothetical protein
MWIVLTFLGCAIKSGVTMMQAEKKYQVENTAENHRAIYEWTMVESYMFKAREEYADSSFEDAEVLAKEAMNWIEKAKTAEKNSTINWKELPRER